MMPADKVIQEYYKRIYRWVHTYPLPPKGFDPTTASDRALAEFGLPARPDRRLKEGAAYRFWKRMVCPPTRFLIPIFPDGTDLRIALFAYQRRAEPALRQAGRAIPRFHHRSSSRNWSGACITPIRPHRFTHVTGAWNVPQADVPRVLPIGANRFKEEYRSSTWLGIGGHRPYNSLPQIGTSQHVEVPLGTGSEQFGAWWQWWVKDRPEHHIPIPILNFPVAAGNGVLASVTVEPPGDVLFHLKNETTQDFVTFKVVAPACIEPLGASAEWIHERPTEFASDRMYPLPSCETVTFQDCRAMSAQEPAGPETLQTLVGSRLIRMTDMFDAPYRSAIISNPHLAGESEVSIAYCEAEP